MTTELSDCILIKIKDLHKKNKIQNYKNMVINAYDYCQNQVFFNNIDHRTYDFIRSISLTLARENQDEYIIDDAEVMSQVGSPGSTFRIEPMKSLADATGGKTSSDIKKIGYFNSMLELEFSQGERYIYFVGPDYYEDFVNAKDPDKFFWESIRGKDIGFVWNYVYGGPYIRKKTPGGVGASKVPYAKGTAGTPEAKPSLPGGKEREIIKKEVQIGLAGKGVKIKQPNKGLKRADVYQEVKHELGKLKDNDNEKDSLEELISWVMKEFNVKNREDARKIAFKIINSNKKSKKKKSVSKSKTKNKQTKLPNVVKGTGKRKEPYRKDKTKQITIEKALKKVNKMDEEYAELRKKYRKYANVLQKTESKNYYSVVDHVKLEMCPDKFKIVHDFFHAQDLKTMRKTSDLIEKYNINVNDHAIKGTLTRSGPFKYPKAEFALDPEWIFDPKKYVIKYKKWENILEQARDPRNRIIPLFGRREVGAHDEEFDTLIGFIDTYIPDEDSQELRFKGFTFEPLAKISSLRNPEDLSVSLRFRNSTPKDEVHTIKEFIHAAVSLDNMELDRCSTVDGWGRCVMSSVSEDTYRIFDTSSPDKRETIKIKKTSRGTDDMTKLNKIDKIIEDFKKVIIEDDISGNEVVGHTNRDKFMNVCQKHNNSPEACEKAWISYNNSNSKINQEVPIVSAETGGHKKTSPDEGNKLSPDVKDMNGVIQKAVEKALKPLKKQVELYEDFFKAKRKDEINSMKDVIKLAFTEDDHLNFVNSIEDDTITMEQIHDLFKKLYKEHPEILPSGDTADTISEINTERILRDLGKTKKDLRDNEGKNDMVEKIKEEAKARLEKMWGNA